MAEKAKVETVPCKFYEGGVPYGCGTYNVPVPHPQLVALNGLTFYRNEAGGNYTYVFGGTPVDIDPINKRKV